MDDGFLMYEIGIATGILLCVGFLEPLSELLTNIYRIWKANRASRILRQQIHELNQTFQANLVRSRGG